MPPSYRSHGASSDCWILDCSRTGQLAISPAWSASSTAIAVLRRRLRRHRPAHRTRTPPMAFRRPKPRRCRSDRSDARTSDDTGGTGGTGARCLDDARRLLGRAVNTATADSARTDDGSSLRPDDRQLHQPAHRDIPLQSMRMSTSTVSTTRCSPSAAETAARSLRRRSSDGIPSTSTGPPTRTTRSQHRGARRWRTRSVDAASAGERRRPGNSTLARRVARQMVRHASPETPSPISRKGP
jgi:hypothetical protein